MNATLRNSKLLAYVLRHNPAHLQLDMDTQGWVPVSQIIANSTITFNELTEIVNNDSKGRYSFNDDASMIRANQGHSTPHVNMDFEQVTPPEILYHGTSLESWGKIQESGGLRAQSRHHVHLSADYETARNVGLRYAKTSANLIVLEINASSMNRFGHVFLKSVNNVYLIENVPIEFITQVS